MQFGVFEKFGVWRVFIFILIVIIIIWNFKMEAVVASLSKRKIDSYFKDGIALNARWNGMTLSGC